MKKNKLYSLLLLACAPLMAGCDPITLGTVTFGSVLWWDIVLIPVRSLLGGTALNLVNTL